MSTNIVSDISPTTHESSGSSPGAILRRCREFHEITLEEASETTKIGITHLKALEDDRIHDFANKAYLKGFLRIYATYLGLNSDDVARMYEKLFGVQDEKTTQPQTSTASQPPRHLFSLKKLIFPAFLLALILVTATFFKRPPPPLVRQPQPPVVVAVPTPPRTAAIQTVQSSAHLKKGESDIRIIKAEKAPVKARDPEPAATPSSPATSSKGFILRIKVTQNGTLTAVVDGSAEQYELAVGDIIEWKAEKKVALDLSNAGGVDIELNGKPYKQLGAPGKPIYVELDANGITP